EPPVSSRLCPRCQRPLPADAPGGPCPHCPAADPTRSAPGSDAPRVAELPLPPRFLSTRPGDDGTLTPAPGGSTVTHGESAPDARDYLPAAPPGYELVRQLGHGGMGSVFLAREHATERTVAIKFLHAPGSPAAYERFLVEVRALARLDHPNVVRVYAVETNWREPFFTMEYAAGGTLADLVADGRPPPDPAAAARLILAAAEGVAAAHAAGILHRDLKPSNVLLANAECGIRNAESGREGSGSGLHSEIRV